MRLITCTFCAQLCSDCQLLLLMGTHRRRHLLFLCEQRTFYWHDGRLASTIGSKSISRRQVKRLGKKRGAVINLSFRPSCAANCAIFRGLASSSQGRFTSLLPPAASCFSFHFPIFPLLSQFSPVPAWLVLVFIFPWPVTQSSWSTEYLQRRPCDFNALNVRLNFVRAGMK